MSRLAARSRGIETPGFWSKSELTLTATKPSLYRATAGDVDVSCTRFSDGRPRAKPYAPFH